MIFQQKIRNNYFLRCIRKANTMELKQFEQLLSNTRRIIAHQKEKEILMGEKFNVFSILRMESRENETHSAFLCELLNPEGTHLKGSLFLQLFLQTIGNQTIDIKTAKTKPENHIGQRNDLVRTGGRIDIFICDNNNHSISIENKIYANDQNLQIVRYCNYNRSKNVVYYLTLNGSEPSKESKGKLKSGEDYFLISYRKHIYEWLQLCLKESVDTPILRETIKQYIILIKKLTHTMNTSEEKELFDIIFKNYEEASIIAANFNKAVYSLAGSVRQKVYDLLNTKLKDKYNLYLGNPVDKRYSQVWLKVKGKVENKIFFGIENFAIEKGDSSSDLCVGIFILDGLYRPEYDVIGEKMSDWWIEKQPISEFNSYKVNLNDPRTLKRLHNDSDFQNEFINHIVSESIQYINEHYESVVPFLN